MKGLLLLLREYFREPESAGLTNGWYDRYRVWPILNGLLVSSIVLLFILQGFGIRASPLITFPLSLVAIASVAGEIIHFFYVSRTRQPRH